MSIILERTDWSDGILYVYNRMQGAVVPSHGRPAPGAIKVCRDCRWHTVTGCFGGRKARCLNPAVNAVNADYLAVGQPMLAVNPKIGRSLTLGLCGPQARYFEAKIQPPSASRPAGSPPGLRGFGRR